MTGGFPEPHWVVGVAGYLQLWGKCGTPGISFLNTLLEKVPFSSKGTQKWWLPAAANNHTACSLKAVTQDEMSTILYWQVQYSRLQPVLA